MCLTSLLTSYRLLKFLNTSENVFVNNNNINSIYRYYLISVPGVRRMPYRRPVNYIDKALGVRLFALKLLLGRPEQPFRTGLCFTADVFLFCHAFSELPRPIALKLCHCHMVGIWLYFIIPLQKFGGRSPQKNLGAKNMQNFGQFWTTSDFDREYLRNG